VREVLHEGADRDDMARLCHGVDVARLETAVAPFDARTAAERSGVPEPDLAELVDAVRRHRRIAFQTGTGTTMAGGANVTEWLVWALHVVTGSYDRPGGMWFNPGFLRQLDRRPSPALDGAAQEPARSRPEVASRYGEHSCAVLADEIEAGHVRVLLVIGGNPLTALPDNSRLARALHTLDALAVLDIARSDTVRVATHVLPCAGPLERADLPHFIDSFQVAVATQYSPRVLAPNAERRPAWWILASLGERLGVSLTPAGRSADECTDEDLLEAIAARGRLPLDIVRSSPTAVVAETAVFGWLEREVLSALPGGRWRVAPPQLVAQLEALTRDRSTAQLMLSPRRQPRHLNSQLRELVHPDGRRDAPSVLLHPDDATDRGLRQGDAVEVMSATGSMTAVVEVTDAIRAGAASVTHGFADANVARLTSGAVAVDQLTGMVRQCGIPLEIHSVTPSPPPPGAPAEEPVVARPANVLEEP
jgi:anaerobic selenocysteine-containing dehydrogenase